MREETTRWLQKAEQDLSDAQYNLEGGRLSTAAFLAQQAAEKAFKAVLVEQQGRFPRIHDLVILAREAKAPEALRNACADLTVAYTEARYPEIGDPITEAQADVLLRSAKEVVAWARRQL